MSKDHPGPMDGQNFTHLSGSPMAHLPDAPPQRSDLSPESLRARIIGAAATLVILLLITGLIILG